MITINANGKKGEYEIKLPTTLDEITIDYLNSVTNAVKVNANYALIGVIFREKLSSIILAARRKKNDSSIPVIPIYIKSGETSSPFVNDLLTGEKIVISPSDIMLGHHVSAPRNLITINNVLDIIDGDVEIYQKACKYDNYCYFIEFKIVPICNIHGSYTKDNNEYINPYITKIKNNSDN